MMFLHMAMVMRLSDLPTGGRFIRPSCGGSVARASAPRVSMIRFTHSNCTAVRGVDPRVSATNETSYVSCQEFLLDRYIYM